jgi:hypothetical protein
MLLRGIVGQWSPRLSLCFPAHAVGSSTSSALLQGLEQMGPPNLGLELPEP